MLTNPADHPAAPNDASATTRGVAGGQSPSAHGGPEPEAFGEGWLVAYHLGKTYGARNVVQDVSLAVRRGEAVVFAGRGGGGGVGGEGGGEGEPARSSVNTIESFRCRVNVRNSRSTTSTSRMCRKRWQISRNAGRPTCAQTMPCDAMPATMPCPIHTGWLWGRKI